MPAHRIPPGGFELHGYSLIEPLPHHTGELEVPLWQAEETGTLDEVLVALLGELHSGREREVREALYDRCLRFSGVAHAALPPYRDSTSPENPDCYVVWTRPPGATLRRRLERGALGLEAALRLLSSAARGLSALHAVDEVHGALCPAVIGIGDRERATLLAPGCGSPRLVDPALVVAARYRAPEQLPAPGSPRGPEIGPPADVWALGALLFEAAEGRPVLTGATVEELRRAALELEAPSLGGHGAPDGAPRDLLDEVLRRSLHPDPDRRFADAGEMADRLDELRSAMDARTVARPSSSTASASAASAAAPSASAAPLIVSQPLTPDWRSRLQAAPENRAAGDQGVPLALWLAPAALLLAVLGLLALLFWWLGVI